MVNAIILKIRKRETPFYDRLYRVAQSFSAFELPVIRPLYSILALERKFRFALWRNFGRIFYYTPLLKMKCNHYGNGIKVIGGLPLILGHLKLNLGNNVTIFGVTTLSGAKVFDAPTLTVGDSTYLGYQLIIDVGCDVTIGKNVLIADRVIIRSYDGHPADPAKRHLPAPPESSKPIVIQDNAWIGAGSIILKGVTIGSGSVVAAGSVVTTKVPSNTLAIGNPARCFPLMLGGEP